VKNLGNIHTWITAINLFDIDGRVIIMVGDLNVYGKQLSVSLQAWDAKNYELSQTYWTLEDLKVNCTE
jgi:hypothetical protein